MSVQLNVLKQAAKRIGYYAPDDPKPGSEAGRYLADKMKQPWLSGPSTTIHWCMCFVSMCLDLEGQISSIGGFFFNTETFLSKNRDNVVPLSEARQGDIVLFDWHDDGVTDHVGLVEANLGNGRIQTIEGNTSSNNAGSQGAGNGVWRRRRSSASGIAYIVRPSYKGSANKTSSKEEVLVIDGILGERSYTRWQKVMGTPVDGVKSEPSPMVAATQNFINNNVSARELQDIRVSGKNWGKLDEDGIDGHKTWKAIQHWIWHHHQDLVVKYAKGWRYDDFVDGVCGEVTAKIFQEILNKSKVGSGRLG